MKTTNLNKVVVNDQKLAARKAKNVKGGPIYMNQAAQNFLKIESAAYGFEKTFLSGDFNIASSSVKSARGL